MHYLRKCSRGFLVNGVKFWSPHRTASSAVALEEDLPPNKSSVGAIPAQEEIRLKSIKTKAWDEELRRSLQQPDYFEVVNMFNVEDLFNNNVHLGHKEGNLNPYMKPYLYGSRLSHYIIDLEQTTRLLNQALNFIAHVVYRDGQILFVCRTKQHQNTIEKIVERCGEFSHTRQWARDTLPNSTNYYRGMVRLPDAIIFLNMRDEFDDQSVGVRDAAKMLIPTVGICDTNCDPRLISYPVPGNDDTASSVYFLADLFARVIKKVKIRRKDFLASVKV